jgi:peptidoglycan/LPS O-acetylase OafA/YrhL
MKKPTPRPVNTREITDLTVCRAFLAGWVFLYHVDLYAQFAHYLGPFAGLVRRGYLGVDGFFILSGLILPRVHPEFIKSPFRGALRFWGKRLARLYPVHLATILILLAVFAAGSAAGMAPRDPGRFGHLALLQNLLLLQGWGFGPHWTWNYPSWSISAEWAGYLLFPLLWFAFASFDAFVMVQFVILPIPLLGIMSHLSGHGLNLTGIDVLPRFFLDFIPGMALSYMVPLVADFVAPAKLAGLGLALALVGAACGWDLMTVMGLALALWSLVMNADTERPPVFGPAPVLRWLGQISYSYYMSFALVELLLANLFRRQGWAPADHALLFSMGMTGLTLVLALALFTLVERPGRRLADRWLALPPPAAPGAISTVSVPLAGKRKAG